MSDPAFALLHGGGQGSWVWQETIAAMRRQGIAADRILALDVPGCGAKRGRDVSALDTDAVVGELLADLRVAGLSEMVLVGHSLAGVVMTRMAESAPELFRRLVYLSCSAPLPGKSPLEQIGSGARGDHPDEVGRPLDPATTPPAVQYRAMFCSDSTEAEGDAFLALLGQDMWPMDVLTRNDWRYDHLRTIPSSYILCERDQSLPPTWQERFAERLHVDRIVRLDAGHQAMNTQPERLARLLIAEAVVPSTD